MAITKQQVLQELWYYFCFLAFFFIPCMGVGLSDPYLFPAGCMVFICSVFYLWVISLKTMVGHEAHLGGALIEHAYGFPR